MSPSRFSLGQRLFAHGGVYALSRLANSSIGFVLLPLYAVFLGDDGYGVVTVLTTLGTFLGVLLGQGQRSSWFRLRFDETTPRDLKVFETSIVWYLLFSVSLGILFLSLVGETLFAVLTPGIPYYPFGLWTVVGAGFLVFVNLYERQLQADQKPIAFAVYSALRTLATLLLIILFVAEFKRGALGRIESANLAQILFAAIAIFLLRPGSPSLVDTQVVRKSLAYGLLFVPHTLAAMGNDLADRLLINHYLGLGATGVYGMGYKIASISFLLATALNQAYSPLFIASLKEREKYLEEGDGEKIAASEKNATRSGLLMVAAVSVFSLLIAASGREAILLLPKDTFDRSWEVIAPVLAGVIALTAYFAFSQTILYEKRLAGRLAYISSLGLGVNIVANVILIPRFGILGAAWATVISNSAMALAALVGSQRQMPLPYVWSRWLAILVTVCLALAAIWELDLRMEAWIPRILLKVLLTLAASALILAASEVAPRHLFRFLLAAKSNK